MKRATKWTKTVWHALHRWEMGRFHARRNGLRLEVSVRTDETVLATIEECKPPVHAVVELARKALPSGDGAIEEAMRWAEAKADELTRASAVVSFDCSAEESQLITKIVLRAVSQFSDDQIGDRMSLAMDIIAVHANGCPLDLEKLLNADSFNFSHDVLGIVRHIDRRTGQLGDFFLPRCAKPERLAPIVGAARA